MAEHTYKAPELEDVDVAKNSAGQLEDLGPVPEEDEIGGGAERYIKHVPTGEIVIVNDTLMRQSPQDVLTTVVRLALRQHEIKQHQTDTYAQVDDVMSRVTAPDGGLSAVGVLVCLRLQEAGLIKPGPDA